MARLDPMSAYRSSIFVRRTGSFLTWEVIYNTEQPFDPGYDVQEEKAAHRGCKK
jgi:hypothetical protein